jgi:uncharacterized protein (DUF58 family)
MESIQNWGFKCKIHPRAGGLRTTISHMPQPALPRVLSRLQQRISARWDSWWLKRHRPRDTLTLTQHNVYILPTRAGLMFALTLFLLLVASINYQLNLGYALTFLLASSGVVSMQITHNTLRGLMLHLRVPGAVFAGASAVLDITLSAPNTRRQRYGIGLRMASAPQSSMVWCDLGPGAQSTLQVSFIAPERGWQPIPGLRIETRFPLGLFRAWGVWRPLSQVLVYPQPEAAPPSLPAMRPFAGHSTRQHHDAQGAEADGVRSYRRGDPLKQVAWKKSARQLETGGDLVSRSTAAMVQQELWLEWHLCAALAPEARLSRLTAWVLQAHQRNTAHGLRLPGYQLAPAYGEAQRKKCLQALALWGSAGLGNTES